TSITSTSEVVGTPVQINPEQTGTSTALCPQGTVLTGGGYRVGNPAVIVTVNERSNNNNQSWTVTAVNLGGNQASVTAVAECAAVS
ncbi:hypothetical protein ACFVZX_41965, partial [Streptomyces erythrochromogenes]